jgi:hypothetical protein
MRYQPLAPLTQPLPTILRLRFNGIIKRRETLSVFIKDGWNLRIEEFMILEKPITAAMVAATATAYYTADPNQKRAIIKKLTFYNSDTVAQSITVYIVPLAGSATATNTIAGARSLLPYETWDCQEAVGITLLGGGMVQALCTTASKVNVQGTVLEHSA